MDEVRRGRGCLTVGIATGIALAVAWVAWSFVLSPVWEDVDDAFDATVPGLFLPVVIVAVTLDIAVSSYVAARLTGYRRSPPTASPRPAPATPDAGVAEPALDERGTIRSGAGPSDVARVAGGTTLIVVLLFGVGACAAIALLTRAMCGAGCG